MKTNANKFRDSNAGTQWAEPYPGDTEEKEDQLQRVDYQYLTESSGLLDGALGTIFYGLLALAAAVVAIGAVIMLFMYAPWWAAVIIVLLVLVLFK